MATRATDSRIAAAIAFVAADFPARVKCREVIYHFEARLDGRGVERDNVLGGLNGRQLALRTSRSVANSGAVSSSEANPFT
jgi:hypothetical protein